MQGQESGLSFTLGLHQQVMLHIQLHPHGKIHEINRWKCHSQRGLPVWCQLESVTMAADRYVYPVHASPGVYPCNKSTWCQRVSIFPGHILYGDHIIVWHGPGGFLCPQQTKAQINGLLLDNDGRSASYPTQALVYISVGHCGGFSVGHCQGFSVGHCQGLIQCRNVIKDLTNYSVTVSVGYSPMFTPTTNLPLAYSYYIFTLTTLFEWDTSMRWCHGDIPSVFYSLTHSCLHCLNPTILYQLGCLWILCNFTTQFFLS